MSALGQYLPKSNVCITSGLRLITDSERTLRNVGCGPIPEVVQSLLNYLVGRCEQRLRHNEAERLGGFQIDHKFVLGGLFHR
jgi:hypothetical protein